MAQQPQATAPPSLGARIGDQFSWAWLGVTPFFLFAIMFLILPMAFLVVGAFQDADGNFTFANLAELSEPTIVSAYWISIKVSVASALGGAIIGFFLAYAIALGRLPRWIRPTLMTFSGVASNFAGLPLALPSWPPSGAPVW
jgi:putative spermidine/putrescine transport system permease protein